MKRTIKLCHIHRENRSQWKLPLMWSRRDLAEKDIKAPIEKMFELMKTMLK